MSAAGKVLDLAEKRGLLDATVIAELRQQVAESTSTITPEGIAKILVDNGHLTSFQARKLVEEAVGQPPAEVPYDSPAAKTASAFDSEDLTLLADDPPPAPATDDEDVVMLEPVEAPEPPIAPSPKPAAAKPTAPKPAKPKSPATPKPLSPPKSERKSKPAAPAVADLTPLDDGLTPLEPAPAQPAPLDDLFQEGTAADPFASPASSAAANDLLRGPTAPKAKKARGNVWDSPLLLVGGGLLGLILIAFGLLFFALTRGSAAEMFGKARDEYRAGSYTSAISIFESFLKKYPDDPNASLARVHIGMARLRQVTDGGKNPRLGLQTAKQVLPEIEKEEKFNEARIELSTILPDIAGGFATQATDATDTAKREELVKLAEETFTLINNPSYMPASLRKEREGRISGILETLKLAQRSIEQDKDLAAALKKIGEAEDQDNASLAYQVRADLLKLYPGLEAHPQLVEAVKKVGEKEQSLVTVSDQQVAGLTDDSQPPFSRVVLAIRNGPASEEAPTKIAYLLIDGAVYAVDVASGRFLWRRYVGYETAASPQPVSEADGADAVIADSSRHELLRLHALTGKVVWRQPIGGRFLTPVIADERIFVTTAEGRLLAVDANTGDVIRSAQFPQQADVPAGYDDRQQRMVQVGQHSTVFLLQPDSLACDETFYLGHKAGAVLVPPVAVLNHVLITESPADDHSLIHVLAPDAKTKRMTEVGRPFRLKGRVVMPLAASGRRIAAMTDLGQVAIYEVDPANREQPVRVVGGSEATERSPLFGFYTLEGNRLWIAGQRCALYEIQGSVQQISRGWVAHQGSTFIGPPIAFGNILIHVRRQPDSSAVTVEGCQAANGQTLWTLRLAAPIAHLAAAEARVDALTEEGRVFSVASEQLRAGYTESPRFPLPPGSTGGIFPDVALTPDGSKLLWTETRPGGRVFSYTIAGGASPSYASVSDSSDRALAPAAAMGERAVVPLESGKVAALDMTPGAPTLLPFMPPLVPDQLPLWTTAAVLPDASGFVIGDGRSTLFRVGINPQPKPHLAAAKQANVDREIHSKLAIVGDTVYGLARGDQSEEIVAIDAASLAIGNRWPLASVVDVGPDVVAGLAFIASESDGLFCFEPAGKLRWQRPQARGPLAGKPVALADGDFLLLFQGGTLARIAAGTGEEIAVIDAGEPLGRSAAVVGQQVFVSTSDGSLVLVPLPKRP